MAEKIIIYIEVDGDRTTLEPIDMGKPSEDGIYKDNIKWYSGGGTINKEHTFALYRYSFSLSRRKFDEEKGIVFGP